MSETGKTLALNIQKYRKLSGLTQADLAVKLGVTFQAVSKWENGKSSPDVLLLPPMAEAFGCSIDALFSYTKKTNDDYVIKQIKSQISDSKNAEKFLSIIAMDGGADMTDEKIQQLVGEVYRSISKKEDEK